MPITPSDPMPVSSMDSGVAPDSTALPDFIQSSATAKSRIKAREQSKRGKRTEEEPFQRARVGQPASGYALRG